MDQEEIAKLGASLRKIDPKTLKPGRVWFCGGEAYFDVFFELDNDEIRWFQFTLRGKSLTWSNKQKFQTGVTNELVTPDISYYPASKTIEDDSQIDAEFLGIVKAVLRSRPDEPLFQRVLTLMKT